MKIKLSQIIFVLLLLFLSINKFSIASSGLDLKEANVTKVSFQKLAGDEYNFDVTLIHDDDSEDGYADKWQVEELEGTILGIRILTHAHGTVEFTRSQKILVSSNIQTVVVRGHDQIHGFGGQVIIISMINESSIFIDQGSEPLDFSSFRFRDFIVYSNSTATMTNHSFSSITISNNESTKNDILSLDTEILILMPFSMILSFRLLILNRFNNLEN